MLLARTITRGTCLKSLTRTATPNRSVFRSTHTININFSIGKGVCIEGVEVGKMVVKQLDNNGNSDQANCTATFAKPASQDSLLMLKNVQLQRLLMEHYELCELAIFVKQHNFTGANLVYGVQNVSDLEMLGINRIQAQTLYQLIQVWKTEGVPQMNYNVVEENRFPAAPSVASAAPDSSQSVTSSATSIDEDTAQQWNQYLSGLNSSNSILDSAEPAATLHPDEVTTDETEPDAELMEWYAHLDIAFIQARWSGQTQQAQLIQRAAESRQDPLAEAYWSILLEKGCYQVRVDRSQALYYARRALPWLLTEATAGNPYAQYHLGFCYTDGRGVPHDALKAVQLYEMAAAQGHEGARVNLGIAYEQGDGVERDDSMAAACYKGAFSHPHALKSYAHCLEHGIGVEAAPDLALFYYKQAAELGHTEAQYKVAKYYWKGDASKESIEEAKKYLRMAAGKTIPSR